jgi:chorismate mutase
MMASPAPVSGTLDALRRDIDRIDAQMHHLLIERSEIIDRLIAVKGTAQSGSAFRPCREASMMKALAERHQGRLPFSTVEHIWRTIIATFTHVQAPYKVHVYNGVDARRMQDIARFQMGFDVPLCHHATADDALRALGAAAGDLAILPLNAPQSAWWDGLGGTNQPQIMAVLPFVQHGAGQGVEAVVLANPLGDAAVDEVLTGVLHAPEPVAENRLGHARILAQWRNAERWSALLAADGMALPQGARPVGSYARPFAFTK